MINEDKLFKLLPYFFQHPSSVLVEIAQNACRSGSSNLDIKIGGDVLEVMDDGKGTDNITAIFCLAESDWSEEVTEQQIPAGWGLFFLMSIAERITYKSLFGEVNVECAAFLNNAAYRERIHEYVDSSSKIEKGFYIKARLMEDVSSEIVQKDLLQCFPLNIRINGRTIERENLSVRCERYPIKTQYLGNDVYINPTRSMFSSSEQSFLGDVSVIWYGILVNQSQYIRNIVLDVHENKPLTPVLPYRSSVKFDDKAERFMSFCREHLQSWCIKELHNYDQYIKNKKLTDLVHVMELAGNVLSQADLDGLGVFFVDAVDSYHSEDSESGSVLQLRLVTKADSPLISERLVLNVDGEIEWDEEESTLIKGEKPTLPLWTITRIDLPRKRPSWLQTEERTVNLNVTVQQTYDKHYLWHRASIDCAGKDIKAISLGSNHRYYERRIYFTEKPEDFCGIQDAVFNMHIYTGKENAAYNEQQNYFSNVVDEDIIKINGQYPLRELLKGMGMTGIDLYGIRNITINREEKIMEVISDTGETTTFKLAA